MPKYLLQKEAFAKCKKEGRIIILENIDLDKIKSTVEIAESDISSAKLLKDNLAKDSKGWNSVYKLYYDALHELVETLLRFDNIKSDNHQCLFVYLCEKHPDMEFDWDFFEKIRTKRNGINYYGLPIKYEDLKEVELPLNLYINKLREEIKKRLKEIT